MDGGLCCCVFQESYAGVYVPMLAQRITVAAQAGEATINLKGFMVGNGCTGSEVRLMRHASGCHMFCACFTLWCYLWAGFADPSDCCVPISTPVSPVAADWYLRLLLLRARAGTQDAERLFVRARADVHGSVPGAGQPVWRLQHPNSAVPGGVLSDARHCWICM
jgi:hypothetical protein